MAGNKSELACVYAALALYDDEIEISADKIKSLVSSAKVDVEPYWPDLFAKLLNKVSMEDLIKGMTAAPTVAAAAPAATAGAAAAGGGAAAEEAAPAKEEEKEEEEDEDMGMDIFGDDD